MVDLAGPGQIRDVDHAVDAFFEFDEGAVGGHVADLALDLLADHVADFDFVPRIRLELADAERDLLLVLSSRQAPRLRFPGRGEDVGRTRDALGPGEFGHADEAFHTLFDLHKRAVGQEARDLALDLLADGEAIFDLVRRVRLASA